VLESTEKEKDRNLSEMQLNSLQVIGPIIGLKAMPVHRNVDGTEWSEMK
jgi:hypothetical protein